MLVKSDGALDLGKAEPESSLLLEGLGPSASVNEAFRPNPPVAVLLAED